MLKVRAVVACDHPGCAAQYETEVTLDDAGTWTRLQQPPQGWARDTCPRHAEGSEDWAEVPTRNDGPPPRR